MKNVRWVIQNNLLAENDLKSLQNACKSNDVEFEEVTIIPFSDELPKFTLDGKINIYYGSTTFMFNLYNKLKPAGLFFNPESYSIANYINQWGEHMLNSGAKITTIKEFTTENHADDSLWFIRPDADDKSFDGTVMAFGRLKNWRKNFLQFDDTKLQDDSKIVVGPPYNIKKEWRNYVVDGKIVSSSLYRTNFKLSKSNIDIPQSMLEFTQERIKEYQPHEIFVIDIALCGDAYYIIECGCLNSVGFYAADINAIVGEVTKYMSNHE
ncbi:MAG: ATP-grasp domain-containing protein [Richelia sp. RM2_1_2]|nr:ATP-grasp domain-containing protein [Richelia sp. RM2_1_2]